MGAKACRGVMDDRRWHANKLLWDCHEKKELPLAPGEDLHKVWDNVEDCVSGLLGTLKLTNLRIIWRGSQGNASQYIPNFSIGLKLVQSVQFNITDSRHYGRVRALSIMTRYSAVVYEFGLALPSSLINEMFYAFESWHKRFKSSRVFRESLVRELKMTKSAVGTILYHPEKMVHEIQNVENICASKKYNGKLILTTHRVIWVSSRSAIVNVSMPFMELKLNATRSSPFGMVLILGARNVSLSTKQCHLRQEVKDGSDSVVLAFKLPSIALVQEIHKFCSLKQREFQDQPFYMPLDGRVIHRLGRWMIVDENTWRDVMGMNETEDDPSESPPMDQGPLRIPLQSTETGDNAMDISGQFDDPLTPHATPVNQFDLGGDGALLDDLANFAEDSQENIAPQRKRTRKLFPPTSPAAAAYRVDPKCVICLTKTPQLAFDPCGHFCTCKNCGEALKECPMCRQEITKSLKVFIVN